MKNPKLIVKPFAKNGQKNVIPENYETSMESNQATWDQGFGQITMLPVAAGGLPPKGQDFNGIFNQISENIVYLSQGGGLNFQRSTRKQSVDIRRAQSCSQTMRKRISEPD